MQAALSPLRDTHGGTIVAFGMIARWRWMQHWRELAASGQMVRDSNDDVSLQLVLDDGSRVAVFFAPHPSAAWRHEDLLRTLAKAHQLPAERLAAVMRRDGVFRMFERIGSVQTVAGGQFMEIAVAAEDERFVLADGVVTHNSKQRLREKLLYAIENAAHGFSLT